MNPFLSLNRSLRLNLVLVAILGLVSLGVASPQDTHKAHKPLRCGSDLKLDTVLNHPDDYFGKTVTVEGEMHRTFNDRVFSIEDDDFLRDDDLLIISNASKPEIVKPVKDSIGEGKDVCVTGVIQPFHRAEMESKFGPLNIESRASHYPEGSPVMIIEQMKTETATSVDLEKPLPSSEEAVSEAAPAIEPAAPVSERVPTELEQQTSKDELPKTGSPLPLIGLSGVISMLAGAIRLRRR
jgi:LPXTG-motif cell wall-anchored protein